VVTADPGGSSVSHPAVESPGGGQPGHDPTDRLGQLRRAEDLDRGIEHRHPDDEVRRPRPAGADQARVLAVRPWGRSAVVPKRPAAGARGSGRRERFASRRGRDRTPPSTNAGRCGRARTAPCRAARHARPWRRSRSSAGSRHRHPPATPPGRRRGESCVGRPPAGQPAPGPSIPVAVQQREQREQASGGLNHGQHRMTPIADRS
jgi:hypothetical protein